MPDYVCHGCGNRSSASDHVQCSQCKKILCSSCREGKSTCRDSKKGKAGCSGSFERLS